MVRHEVQLATSDDLLMQRAAAALRHADLAARRTLETLKEDTQWVKDQMR